MCVWGAVCGYGCVVMCACVCVAMYLSTAHMWRSVGVSVWVWRCLGVGVGGVCGCGCVVMCACACVGVAMYLLHICGEVWG